MGGRVNRGRKSYLHPLPAHYRQPPATPKRFVRAILGCIDKRQTRRHGNGTFVAEELVALRTAGLYVWPIAFKSP